MEKAKQECNIESLLSDGDIFVDTCRGSVANQVVKNRTKFRETVELAGTLAGGTSDPQFQDAKRKCDGSSVCTRFVERAAAMTQKAFAAANERCDESTLTKCRTEGYAICNDKSVPKEARESCKRTVDTAKPLVLMLSDGSTQPKVKEKPADPVVTTGTGSRTRRSAM